MSRLSEMKTQQRPFGNAVIHLGLPFEGSSPGIIPAKTKIVLQY